MSNANGERLSVARLLRRAGFGAPPSEIDRCAAQGYEATVDDLIHPERIPDNLDDDVMRFFPEAAELNDPPDGQTWWAWRMLKSPRPLEEKMALFWHDHFATSYQKVKPPLLLFRQYVTIRGLALADFDVLLKAVARDPAMIFWLDNNTNKKDAPNENFGRELLELFSLGIGNYTEEDVKASARSFTGWTVNNNRRAPEFVFNANEHDGGIKTFLGRSGPFNGDEIIDIISNEPATARYLAGKLHAFFVADEPDEEAIARIAKSYSDNRRNLRLVLRDLFMSPTFRDASRPLPKVKNPPEFVVGAMRELGVESNPQQIARSLKQMGMELFSPPTVAGWDWGDDWIDTSLLLERINGMSSVLRAGPFEGLSERLEAGRGSLRSAGEAPQFVVSVILDTLGLDAISPDSRAALTEFARGELAAAIPANARAGRAAAQATAALRQINNAQRISTIIQGAIALPEYQLA